MIRINIFKGNTMDMLTNKTNIMVIEPHGYLLQHGNEFSLENDDVFDLLNWSHWADKKPELLFSDIDTCGSGIILNLDDTNDYYLAMSVGWKKFNSFKELYNWYSKNWNDQGKMFKDTCCSVHAYIPFIDENEYIPDKLYKDKDTKFYLSISGIIKDGILIDNVNIAFIHAIDYSIHDNGNIIKVNTMHVERILTRDEINEQVKFINDLKSSIIEVK